MPTWKRELVDPPLTHGRSLELWLQHAAGRILFDDVRGYAIERIDPTLSEDARNAARKSIDDAVYGLMMVLDGVSGTLENSKYRVELQVISRLMKNDASIDQPLVASVDLANGDGMCMGYHGWLEDDFGEDPIVTEGAEAPEAG